jgi:hypothetical protein
MKSIEQMIFETRFKGEEFDANDYNDWAKENEWEAYTICLSIAKQLLQHGVMQAEGSDVSEGATVASEGQGEANTCAGFCECTKPRGDINHFGCMNCQKQIRA